MYVLCLFTSRLLRARACVVHQFKIPLLPPKLRLADRGRNWLSWAGGGPCQPAWQMTPSRRKRSKLPPVDQPDWCSVGDHQSPVCRLTPYRISRLKMQNRQTGRSARPSVIETPYPVHLPPWRKANRISMEWMKIIQSIDLAHVQQGLYLDCKHRAGDLLPQFCAPAPTARERRSG